ncbi:MAG: hypothetical protein ACRCWQ_10960 [Bacilli bacterium]
MFKKIIISIFLLSTSLAHASVSTNKSVRFDQEQIKTLRAAYFEGADRGYGWVLAAIAWQESSAGKNKVNFAGPAYGVYHNLLSSVARRHGITKPEDKVKLSYRLVTEDDYAAQQAMLELDYWMGRHKGNLNKAIASYYAGNNWSSTAGQNYKNTILSKIKYLQRTGVLL